MFKNNESHFKMGRVSCIPHWHHDDPLWSFLGRAFTNQSLTIPRYNEHFGCFPSNSLYRGFLYNEPSNPHFIKSTQVPL